MEMEQGPPEGVERAPVASWPSGDDAKGMAGCGVSTKGPCLQSMASFSLAIDGEDEIKASSFGLSTHARSCKVARAVLGRTCRNWRFPMTVHPSPPASILACIPRHFDVHPWSVHQVVYVLRTCHEALLCHSAARIAIAGGRSNMVPLSVEQLTKGSKVHWNGTRRDWSFGATMSETSALFEIRPAAAMVHIGSSTPYSQHLACFHVHGHQ